jgi:hypothetical protein
MSADLERRANALRAKAALLESVPGSGLHDSDRNPARPDLYLAPQRNGLPRASEAVVYFTDYPGEEVLFAPGDAARALDALRAWEAAAKKLDPMGLTGTERKLLTRILPRLAAGADGLLRVRLDQWNDVIHALHERGVGLAGLPLEE